SRAQQAGCGEDTDDYRRTYVGHRSPPCLAYRSAISCALPGAQESSTGPGTERKKIEVEANKGGPRVAWTPGGLRSVPRLRRALVGQNGPRERDCPRSREVRRRVNQPVAGGVDAEDRRERRGPRGSHHHRPVGQPVLRDVGADRHARHHVAAEAPEEVT